MASKITLTRICRHCGKDFTARTTVTQFCGDSCAKQAYKLRVRAGKIEASEKETQRTRNRPIDELKAREFLSVTQVSKLIGCSRQNVYKLIRGGRLKATNLLRKKTIVRRSDIESLFHSPPSPKR
jgi:excisionase family DNA binding protein